MTVHCASEIAGYFDGGVCPLVVPEVVTRSSGQVVAMPGSLQLKSPVQPAPWAAAGVDRKPPAWIKMRAARLVSFLVMTVSNR
jgi:hypothetical protein